MTPSQVYAFIRTKWKKEWSISFLSVMAFGLVTHMYKLTNTLPNWDSLNNFYSDQNTIHLGRCFLTFACGISSFYDLPWLNGILSLVYLGICAILVCELFEIKKTPVLILTGGLIAAFPAVTSTFAYMYTADGYFLGMLCMTLAIYLTLRRKRGWIGGLFLLGFGYGCYQAYITWALLLVLFWTITQLLYTDTSFRELLRKWGHAALCGMLGTLFYLLCSKVMLQMQGASLASYQGIREAGTAAALQPLAAAGQCLIDFAYFFIGPLGRMNLYSYLNCIMLALAALFTVWQVIHIKLYRDVKRFALCLISCLAVPFAAFAIYFVSPGTGYHMLMMMSLCLVYLYFLLFFEKETGPGRLCFRQWLITVLTALTVWQFIVTANVSYQLMQSTYDRSYATLLRIADRIERTEGTAACQRMTVIGQLPGSEDLSVNLPPDMTGIVDGYLMSTPLHYQAMLSHYCGLDYALADEAERLALSESSIVNAMPAWPESGSIAVVDHVLVINLGDVTDTFDAEFNSLSQRLVSPSVIGYNRTSSDS